MTPIRSPNTSRAQARGAADKGQRTAQDQPEHAIAGGQRRSADGAQREQSADRGDDQAQGACRKRRSVAALAAASPRAERPAVRPSTAALAGGQRHQQRLTKATANPQARAEGAAGPQRRTGRQPDRTDVVADLRCAQAQRAAGVVGRTAAAPGEQRGVALRRRDRVADAVSAQGMARYLGGRAPGLEVVGPGRRRPAPPSASWAAGRGRSRFRRSCVAVLGRHLAAAAAAPGRERPCRLKIGQRQAVFGHQCAHLAMASARSRFMASSISRSSAFPCAATVPGLHGWPFDTPGNSSFRRAPILGSCVVFPPLESMANPRIYL